MALGKSVCPCAGRGRACRSKKKVGRDISFRSVFGGFVSPFVRPNWEFEKTYPAGFEMVVSFTSRDRCFVEGNARL